MIKVILKIGLVVMIAAMFSVGIGQCTKDFRAEAAEVADWKECNAEGVIANTLEEDIYYTVVWYDHDIITQPGPLSRAGGELPAGEDALAEIRVADGVIAGSADDGQPLAVVVE